MSFKLPVSVTDIGAVLGFIAAVWVAVLVVKHLPVPNELKV